MLLSGTRTGNGVGPQLRETFERVCKDAEALVRKEQAQRRVAVTLEALDEKIDHIRGAVTMGKTNVEVPFAGLPGWQYICFPRFYAFTNCSDRCFKY